MLDLGKINTIELFKAFAGSGASGRLRVFILPELDTDNPYDLPEVITPTLLLTTECVSIKLQTRGVAGDRESSGLVNYSFWKCSVDGQIAPEKLRLGAYAVIDKWNNQVIKGILDQVDRKHSNRYRVTIDTAQNVPFEVIDSVIEVTQEAIQEVIESVSQTQSQEY
jgi:hypothetical protein